MIFFDQKLLFTYPYASIKDVEGTGDAFPDPDPMT